MKICMVTGGSGGHIYPAITFADYVKNTTDHEVFFIGNDHKMESTIVPKSGYDFYSIHNQGLQGSKLDKVKAVFGQFKAIRQSKKLLKKTQPDLVFGFGGYVTLPVVIAAHKLKIKVVLHEQNAFVGKANKWAAKYADAIFTCYEEAFSEESKAYLYGNPRAALAQDMKVVKDELNRIGLDENKKIVLCVMGSQGSQTMNKVFKDVISKLDNIDYQIVFVTGSLEYDSFMQDLGTLPKNVYVESFVNQGQLLPFVDLIFARAGASTLTEVVAFEMPSILVPSPYVANNHQYFNAKALADKNATILFEEKDITAESMIEKIESTLNDEALQATLKENVKHFATPNVNKDILNKIESIVK